jgi:hypothetical protein
MSLCLSACNSSGTAERNLIKFDIGGFTKIGHIQF